MTTLITFAELKTALVLRAAFEDFLAMTPGALGDVEKARILFFTRWAALPDMIQASCVLASLVKSPGCQRTPEVLTWQRIQERASAAAAVAERVN